MGRQITNTSSKVTLRKLYHCVGRLARANKLALFWKNENVEDYPNIFVFFSKTTSCNGSDLEADSDLGVGQDLFPLVLADFGQD